MDFFTKILFFLLSLNFATLAFAGDKHPKQSDDRLSKQDPRTLTSVWTTADPIPPELMRDSSFRDFIRKNLFETRRKLSPREKLDFIRKRLEATLIGQPEIVDALIEIESKDLVLGPGHRQTPEVLYLMGLPGTGKDTAAKAYADVIGDLNAYRENLYYLPVARDKADLWRTFGSNTGYVGSSNISPFIKWLVDHSGGRYNLIVKGEKQHVEEDPNWNGKTDKAVVYVDEFHNWSSEAKDALLKQALEKGYFPINNPGDGIAEIYVPITFIIASNDGVNLLAARNADGVAIGKPLSYEALLAKWEGVHHDKEALVKAITSNNATSKVGGSVTVGISEELINRVPKRNLLLTRPLSPENLLEITQIKLAAMQHKFKVSRGEFGKIDINWNQDVVNFIQQYKFNAEEGARSIDDKISELIEATIVQELYDLPTNFSDKNLFFNLGIKKESDGTFSLTFECNKDIRNGGFSVVIDATKYNLPPARMSQERILELSEISAKLNEQVFGVGPILERLGQAVLVSEERGQNLKGSEEAGAPARVFLFLGLSSTGKTETAKALTRINGGNGDAMKVFDFSQVRTVEDIKVKILGGRDRFGREEKSEFMEHYDKHSGKILVVLDEIANAPRDVLKALYDILREPVITTFSDKKPRRMAEVLILGTGNAGEEWFRSIPRDIPKSQQQAAMREIYVGAMKDPGYRRQFLEEYFSEALLNRVGEKNIFFFPPHDYKSIRQLSQLKLAQALSRLEPSKSGWGWNIKFLSKNDYVRTLETIETEGFVIREQGASIEKFVTQEFEEGLRGLLLRNQVKAGSDVVLKYSTTKLGVMGAPNEITFHVLVESSSQPLEFSLSGAQENKPVKISEQNKIVTAYHEVGHELVRQTLLADKFESQSISIVPGVANIAGRWVHYLGLARYERTEYLELTRQAVIELMAGILAGEAAEIVVTGQYTGGKGNDIERATALARRAVLELGLSEAWGNEAVPGDVTITDYLGSLSNERKILFEQEVQIFLGEARSLAHAVIMANYHTHFVPMALKLSEKGVLNAEELAEFYSATPTQKPKSPGLFGRFVRSLANSGLLVRLGRYVKANPGREANIKKGIPVPSNVSDVQELVTRARAEAVAEVALPKNVPILKSKGKFREAIKNLPGPTTTADIDLSETEHDPATLESCPGSFLGIQ
jgi:ATP-dependent Clp protease ATP-binding subunit ClpA